MKHFNGFDAAVLIILFSIIPTEHVQDGATPAGKLLSSLVNFSILGRKSEPIYPQIIDIDQDETYDFIIIGSSPSGAVMANRLSEIHNWKILLLEAGEEPSSFTDIPLVCGLIGLSEYNWGYRAEKQPEFCRGCYEKSANWGRGKALGGSSIINYMIHIRGNPADYDKWAQMGNPGWSYQDVLPYFIKLENASIKLQDEKYHGQGGHLSVSDVPFKTEAVKVYLQGAQEAGYPYVDYNGKRQLGVSYVQANLRNGRRHSAEKAFLRPIRKRSNLKILIRARVLKILINHHTKETYGVQYYRDGKYYRALAKREVILTAGALNSPQLLMLSGIGPKTHLNTLGIPVIQDLPVGRKIYDHITFPAIIFHLNQHIVLNFTDIYNISAIYDFLYHGQGSYTSIGGVEALTFMKLPSSLEPQSPSPDMEFMFIGGALSTDFGLIFRRLFNFPARTYNKFWKPLEILPIYQILPMLLHPQSYGYMKLRSKDPFDSPKFYANYLSDPQNHDVRLLIEAVREIQRINESPTLQKYGAKMVMMPFPGCENHIFDSDSYWECSFRSIVGSLFHQVSACKMGPENDPEAVVNARLQVYGVQKLRVADQSVLPVTLSAHTVAPSYMIGEKAADIIKEDWGITITR